MEPAYTLLKAVEILHDQGYEGLRVYPTVYATGHWRCSLSVVGQPLAGIEPLFRYSSGQGWDFFAEYQGTKNEQGGEAPKLSVVELAGQLVARFPAIAEQTKFACPAYTVWFAVLLEYCGENGSFYLSSEDYAPGNITDAKTAGYVRVRHAQKGNLKFPLAPVF